MFCFYLFCPRRRGNGLYLCLFALNSLWRILTRWTAFCVQPPPPVNDTNPYNVFRPREKAHRLHTRRVGGKLGTCFHCTSLLGKCFSLKGMSLFKTSNSFRLTYTRTFFFSDAKKGEQCAVIWKASPGQLFKFDYDS